MATKVTELMPQKSWISKWFNTSQDISDSEELNNKLGAKYTEIDDEADQAPPLKRPRIRMDIVHPPGTFSIQSRDKSYDSFRYKYNNSVKKTNNFKPDFPSFTSKTIDETLETPVAGPSGIRPLGTSTPAVTLEYRSVANQRSELNSLVSSQNNGATNGLDDNSESSESTSGCSSLIPQTNRQDEPSTISYDSTFSTKRKLSDTLLGFNTFVGNHSNQSRRTLFLNCSNRETMSSRRPTFNASVVNNSIDKNTTLASPFYNGNTTFGGASAANLFKKGRNLFNSSSELQLKVPKRVTVQVQPPNNINDNATMSQTTKRILETLENFSSIVTDAKKMPVKRRSEIYSPSSMRKRIREEDGNSTRVGLRHLSRELVVPTVADMLKIKRRQKLQDTTIAARKIMSTNNQPSVTKEYQIRNEADAEPEFQGKLKSNRRGKNNIEEEKPAEAVNLPSIVLPISTLPKFDIALPQRENKSTPTKQNDNTESFKFASPIRVSDAPKNLHFINSFTFSEPLTVENKDKNDENSIESSKTVILDNPTSVPNFIFTATSSSLKLKSKTDSGFDEEIKSGSTMDTLCKKPVIEKSTSNLIAEKEKNTEDVNIWECTDCYIKNIEKDDKCTACRAKKPVTKKGKDGIKIIETKEIKTNDFGTAFKLQSNQWECDCCLIRNNQSDTVCVSCSSPKPGVKEQKTTGSLDLMNKFKPAEGSWECSGCMLRNPQETLICPCCTTPKLENKSADNIKVQTEKVEMKSVETEGANWECPCCMVRSKASVLVCPCCEAPKPTNVIKKNSNIEEAESQSSNSKVPDLDKPKNVEKQSSNLKIMCDMPVSSTTFKFGIDHDKSSTMSTNVLLSNSPLTKAASFSFGVPKTSETETVKQSFSFGINTTSTNKQATVSPFVFAPKEEDKKIEELSVKTAKNDDKPSIPTTSVPFSFGTPKENIEKPANPNFSFGNSKDKETSSVAGFSFGASKSAFNMTINKPTETKPMFGSLLNTENENKTSTNTSLTFPAPSVTTSDVISPLTSITPTFNFGSSSNSTPNILSSVPAKTQTPSQPTFAFPEQPKSSPIPSFGSNLSTATTISSSSFSFGNSKTPETPSTTQEIKTINLTVTPTTPQTFNNPAESSMFSSDSSKSAIQFGGFDDKKTATSSPMFGAVENKTSLFGTPSNAVKNNVSSTPPAFGNTNKTSTSTFGTMAQPFGNASAPNFFSTSQPELNNTTSTSSPSLFTFGSSNSQSSQPSSTSYNFTAPASAHIAQKSMFGFAGSNTASPTTQQPPQAAASFGGTGFGTNENTFPFGVAPKSEANIASVFRQSTVPSSTIFNNASQPTPTTFPVSQPCFNFGAIPASNPTDPNAGFNFSAAGQTSAASSSNTGYNFNASNTSTVAFDPNTRPSFNFTGGNAPPTFNATPVATSGNIRKIKKAVRRMPPR